MAPRAPAKSKKPAPRRAGASRNTRKTPPKKTSGGTKGIVWLGLGLVMGLLVAFGVLLLANKEDKPEVVAEAVKEAQPDVKVEAPAPAPVAVEEPAIEEPRFDFYTLLPSQEVMPDQSTTEATARAAQQAQTQSQTATSDGPYHLQAGSFSSQDEADKRRAAVLMLGLNAKIMPTTVDGNTRYRVMVGPLKTPELMQTAQASLRANGIDSVRAKQ